jgi:hypothetical protein
MKKWEYIVRGIKIPGKFGEDELNEFGNDGWELVNYGFDACIGIFKRPIEPLVEVYLEDGPELPPRQD